MKGRSGKTYPAPTPEEQQLIELCGAYANRHGLAFKVVRMPFPEPRLGLGFAGDGDLDPVVARFRVLKKGPAVRAYSPLPANLVGAHGKSEVRVEGRMQSQTVWLWPMDQVAIARYLDACVAAVRESVGV